MSLYTSVNFASPHSIKCFCRNDLKAAYSGQLQAVTGIPLLYTSLYIGKIFFCHKSIYTTLSLLFHIQPDAKPHLPESTHLASYPSKFPFLSFLNLLHTWVLKIFLLHVLYSHLFPSWYAKGYQKASILISCLDASNVFSVKVAEVHQEEIAMT